VLVDDERGEVVVLATVFQAVPPVLLGPRHAPRIAAGSEGKKAVPDGREEPWRQHAVGNRATSPPGARRKSGPGQMNSFHSESTTQERSVSSRKRSLTRGGISAASEACAGGLCVTGKTSTRVSAGSAAGRSAATIAQGRSF